MLIFFFKTIILVVLAIVVRGVLPRMRVDHLISINWKFFILILIFFFIHYIILYFLF